MNDFAPRCPDCGQTAPFGHAHVCPLFRPAGDAVNVTWSPPAPNAGKQGNTSEILCPIGTCHACDEVRSREQDARCPTRAKQYDSAASLVIATVAALFFLAGLGILVAGVIHG